jgi:hypothetical protein
MLFPFALHAQDPADHLLGYAGGEGFPPCPGLVLWIYDPNHRETIELGPLVANYGQDFRVRAVDLDQDGNTDLVLSVSSQVDPLLLWGDGAGHFVVQPLPLSMAPQPDGSSPIVNLFAADFDGDGYPDLALVLRSGVISVLYNQGAAAPRQFR